MRASACGDTREIHGDIYRRSAAGPKIPELPKHPAPDLRDVLLLSLDLQCADEREADDRVHVRPPEAAEEARDHAAYAFSTRRTRSMQREVQANLQT